MMQKAHMDKWPGNESETEEAMRETEKKLPGTVTHKREMKGRTQEIARVQIQNQE